MLITILRSLRQLCTSRNVQNFFWITFINGVLSLLGLYTAISLANTLGLTTFGVYSYLLALSVYGMVMVRYGRDRNMVKSLIQKPQQTGEIIAASILLGWLLAIPVIIAFAVYLYLFESTLGVGGYLIMIGAIAVSLDLQPVFDSQMRMTQHAVYHAANRMIYFFLIWIGIIYLPRDVDLTYVGIATVAGLAISLFLQYRDALQHINNRIFIVRNFRGAYGLLKQNFSITLSTLLSLISGPLIGVALKHFCGEDEVGLYSVGFQIAAIGSFFLAQVARVGNPLMARATSKDVNTSQCRREIGRYTAVMVAVTLPMSLPLIIWPDAIIRTLYKAEFAAASNSLPFIGMYVLTAGLGVVASQYLISTGQNSRYLINVTCGAVAALICGLLLIPTKGAAGAAMTLVISHGVGVSLDIRILIQSIWSKEQIDTEKSRKYCL